MEFTQSHFSPGSTPFGTSKLLDDGRVVCSFTNEGMPPSSYVYDQPLILAINVAMATRRPLLLAGEPGCGKTTLASNVAQVQDWAYYHHTIGSRSQASELLWDVDTLRRLNDAYDPKRRLLGEDSYIQPGKLWWALAPESARYRGVPPKDRDLNVPPLSYPPQHRAGRSAVLLIDEIDKAEPDVPNDLLEVLDTSSFYVRDRRIEPERRDVLVIITTNLERDLPGAFMRRCVVYRFPDALPGWFSGIALQRHPKFSLALAQRVEQRLLNYRKEARESGARLPGTAEYLDALVALNSLGLGDAPASDAADTAWAQLERCVFGKHAAVQAG